MKKILLIDDNEGLRQFISDFLRWRNFIVIEARDGLEGWQLAISQKPDLILSDIDMPRMDGYGLLEKLHQDMGMATTPIILLSGIVTDESRDNALRLGAADFLAKPFLPDEVLTIISNCLKSSNLLSNE